MPVTCADTVSRRSCRGGSGRLGGGARSSPGAGLERGRHQLLVAGLCMEDLQTFSAQLSMVEATCRAHAELTDSALYDALTALPNRAHFVRRLDAVVNAATGSEHQVGLLLIDLDDLKDVNDTFGHAAGDQVLTEVARRIARIVGDRCLTARLGGD